MSLEFSSEEKAEAFDEIAEHFYHHNFGQMSKADFELLMFHLYFDKMTKSSYKEDHTFDYNKISDYRISLDLGITQQRVRNLKVKNRLVYNIDIDWRLEFADLIKKARYDLSSKKIIINIPDPNLFLEIQNFLEEKGGYIEKQLNTKILQIRVEYFIALIAEISNDDEKKVIVKEINKEMKRLNKVEISFEEKNIGWKLLEAGVNVTTIISNVSNICAGGFPSILFSSLKSIIS